MAGEQQGGYSRTIDKFTYDGITYILQDNTSGYIKDAGVTSFNGSTGAVTYTLPTASDTTLGGIKVGDGLAIDANGVLSSSGGVSALTEEEINDAVDAAFG